MVEIIKFERLKEVLNTIKGIEVLKDEEVLGEFNRIVKFNIRGKNYTIEWYKNLVTLYIGRKDFENPSLNFRSLGVYTYSCRSSESLFFYDNLEDGIVGKNPEIKFEIPITKNEEKAQNIIPRGMLIA